MKQFSRMRRLDGIENHCPNPNSRKAEILILGPLAGFETTGLPGRYGWKRTHKLQ